MDITRDTDTPRDIDASAGLEVPDISFFFAVHRHMRADLRRYAEASPR